MSLYQCEHCGATIEENISGETTEEQVKAWNTRAIPDWRGNNEFN